MGVMGKCWETYWAMTGKTIGQTMETLCGKVLETGGNLQGNDERQSLETCWGSEWEVMGQVWESYEQTNGTIDVDDREVMGKSWGMLGT